MRSLLDLISNVKDVNVVVRIIANEGGAIRHKTHKRLLDDQILLDGGFKTNFGGYGSFSRLNAGPRFSASWEINGIDFPKGKNFYKLRVFFDGEVWATPLTKLKELVNKLGGELVDRCEIAQLIVISDSVLLPESTNQLSIHESTLHRLSPFSPEIKAKKKPVLPLTGDAVGIWKLITSRDRSSIDQGVALAAALPAEIEQLLCNCEVSDSGELHRGGRFTSTGPAQRYLDLALLAMLSMAPKETIASSLKSKIKRLCLPLAGIPHLRGFDSLEVLEITLAASSRAENLKNLGKLPSLRSLSIIPEGESYRRASATIKSTEGLIAPILESLTLIAVNLELVVNLSNFVKLKKIDLSENENLQNISGEDGCLFDIEAINFSKCKRIKTLSFLSGNSKISRANFKDCQNLEDLNFLAKSKKFDQLVIEGCASIKDLHGLDGATVGGSTTDENSFDLVGCDSLISIKGFPSLVSPICRVDLSQIDGLKDLDGLDSANQIKELKLEGLEIKNLRSLAGFNQLEILNASKCVELVDASVLEFLVNLKSVNFKDCVELTRLPKNWGDRLETLNVEGCSNLTSLGNLTSSVLALSEDDFEIISLKGCAKLNSLSDAMSADFVSVKRVDLFGCVLLKSLDGLDSTQSLTSIQLPNSIADVSALRSNRKLEITFDMNGITSFPIGLATSLATLKAPRLKIKNGDDLLDCSCLSSCSNLVEIDFSSAYKLIDIDWILNMPKLQAIRLAVGSPVSKKHKVTNIDSSLKVRALQKEICNLNGLNLQLYSHLNVSVQEVSKKQGLKIRDLRKSLLSNDFLTAYEGIKLLSESRDEGIYKEILDEIDTDLLFEEADSSFENGIFKNVKASLRPLAKLVTLWLLITAPESSEFVQDRLSGVRKINLKFKAPLIGNVIPDLTKLSSLREVDFDNIDLLDLSCLKNATSLRKLSISNAPSLGTVSGIEKLNKLQSFSIYDCPNMRDLMALSDLSNIKDLNIYDTGPLGSIAFAEKLKRINDLSVTVSSKTDLSCLKNCPWIEDLTLHLKPEEDLRLNIEMPQLQKLSIRSSSPWGDAALRPTVSFDKLAVLNLNYIHFFGISLVGFNGICHVKDIDFYYCDVRSFSGIEATSLVALDLRGIDKMPLEFFNFANLSALRRLTLPNDETVGRQLQLNALQGLSEIEFLDTTGLHGSLKWLEGWNSLRELRLEKSGRLIDLDVLSKLPKIETLSFRGGIVKKDQLPDSVQSKSIFK
jgi:hypothetical protein